MIRNSIAALVILACVSVHAQQSPQMQQQSGSPEEPRFYFYEAINLVALDSSKSRVDIPYRIDHQFFIPVKNEDATFPHPFKRRGEVLIELVDENGISKARDINRFDIGAKGSEARLDDISWYEGIASFSVPPGEYTIVFEIDDLESERQMLQRDRKIIAKKFDGATFETSTPLFVQGTNAAASGNLVPLNFGGNIVFDKGAALFLQLNSKLLSKEPVRIEYTISTKEMAFEDHKTIIADTIAKQPLLTDFFAENVKQDESPAYRLVSPNISSNTAAVLIPLTAEKLPLRPFILNLKITQGPAETNVQHNFRMMWPEMPMSLRDIDFALEALKYITNENELDSLRSGGREKRLIHLEEFWRTKDRTPNTTYNEVMVEYYRRVDYAQRSFSSIRGGDGYKSDRGRVYILYGPPTTTERMLNSSTGYQEIWKYEKQGKKFVFVDQSKSGNYTLVATQNL